MGWKFFDDTDAAIRDLEAAATKNTRKSAERVIARAKVPVRTGFLKNSGYISSPQSVDGHAATVVGYEAEYAQEVHDGHMASNGRFVAGRPFLTNSLNADEENLEDDVERDLLKLGCTRVDRF